MWKVNTDLGVDEAVEKFTGTIIAIVHRNDDIEEKWVVAPEGMSFTKEEIVAQRWQEVLKDTDFVPIDVHTPIWLWRYWLESFEVITP